MQPRYELRDQPSRPSLSLVREHPKGYGSVKFREPLGSLSGCVLRVRPLINPTILHPKTTSPPSPCRPAPMPREAVLGRSLFALWPRLSLQHTTLSRLASLHGCASSSGFMRAPDAHRTAMSTTLRGATDAAHLGHCPADALRRCDAALPPGQGDEPPPLQPLPLGPPRTLPPACQAPCTGRGGTPLHPTCRSDCTPPAPLPDANATPSPDFDEGTRGSGTSAARDGLRVTRTPPGGGARRGGLGGLGAQQSIPRVSRCGDDRRGWVGARPEESRPPSAYAATAAGVRGPVGAWVLTTALLRPYAAMASGRDARVSR
jgi:hypothetical protein